MWHREANRDHEAELRNLSRLSGNASGGAGSRNAAHFLRFYRCPTDSPSTFFALHLGLVRPSTILVRAREQRVVHYEPLVRGLNAYAHAKL